MGRETGFYKVREEYAENNHGRWMIAKWDSEAEWWLVCGNEIPHYDEDFVMIDPIPISLPLNIPA